MKQELALQQVFETICQLQLDNKQVSVANIKNKMVIPAPLPLITRAISAFKADPQSFLDSYRQNNQDSLELPDETVPLSLEQRVQQLEQQVKDLTQQLARLTKS